MKALQLQGIGFCVVAVAATLATAFLKIFTSSTEVIFLASMIACLGLPHGALDTIFAKKRFQIQGLKTWFFFGLIYIGLSAFVVGLWTLLPIAFLISFLLISVFHFSADPLAKVPFLFRLLYGGAIIFLPTVLHSTEVLRLFSYLLQNNQPILIVQTMQAMAWPWAISIGLACVFYFRSCRQESVEMASVAILAIFAPPLIAFTVFFCGMHSARHILRSLTALKILKPSSFKISMTAILGTLLFVYIAATVAWLFQSSNSLDARIIQIVFVGLAALTVPHMILIDSPVMIRLIKRRP